jgi:ribosomal protein L7/L12
MTTKDETSSNLEQVQNLQIRLSEVASIARLGDEQFGDDADVGGPFCIIARELDSISSELDGVIRNDDDGPKSKDDDGKPNRDDASLAASELKALLDVLTGAATSNLTLFDETLETLAGTMMDKAQTLCSYFRPPESNDEYKVRLVSFGENKVSVIKAVRDNVPEDGGLKWAKDLVESAPVIVAEYASRPDAEDLAGNLEAAGATCDVLQGGEA